MRTLFLSNNPNLGSTARILQCWLRLGPELGLKSCVALCRKGDFSRWLGANGIEYLVDPMPWPNRLWPFPGMWHAWKVARWARRFNVDLIHCNEHDMYPFAILLRRLLPRPLVCHVRFHIGRPFCEWTFAGDRGPDALLWTSKAQRDDCAGAVEGIVPAARQHIVYLGLDLETFGTLRQGREATRQAWKVGPDEIVLGTASALLPRKRIEDFIQLVAELARQDHRVVGVIAGDAMPGEERYREELFRRAAQTGLGQRLKWLGNLEPVEPFYHAIDVFVSTSEYETFGNSVCEAMACSRPVVAYRGGSVAEVIGDAGLIVETGNLSALISGAARYVCDPELRASIGVRARNRVAEQFDPLQSLRIVRRLYDSLVPQRGEDTTDDGKQ